MRKVTADYICPISRKPIPKGVLVLDDKGEIQAVSSRRKFEKNELEYFEGCITPGFVNAHCHLELSFLEKKIKPGQGLATFIVHLLQAREKASETEIKEAVTQAEQTMIENGIVAVGDIVNTDHSFFQKAKEKLAYHTFIEIMALDASQADEVIEKGFRLFNQVPDKPTARKSLTPHAPYSVSSDLLSKLDAFSEKHGGAVSFHMQESEAENQFLKLKEGELTKVYETLGIDISLFEPTKKRSLKSTLPYFSKDRKLLLVHNTYTNSEEIQWTLNRFSNVWYVLCPKANLYIEQKMPPVQSLVKNKARICLGTDSIASNDTLSILEEMKTLSKRFPDLSLQRLLTWGTLNGAKALGFDDEFGTLAQGKTPGLNLIKDMDLDNLKLTPESKVEVLV